GAGFESFIEGGESLDVTFEICEHVFAFAGQFEIGFDVAGAAYELFIVGDEVFKALAIAHDGLGSTSRTKTCPRGPRFRGGVVPEGWIGEFLFYVGEFPADASRVKDTPAGREPGRGREHKRIRDRLTTCFALMT